MKRKISIFDIDFYWYLKLCWAIFMTLSIPFVILSLFNNILELNIISFSNEWDYTVIWWIFWTILSPIFAYLFWILAWIFSYLPFKFYIKSVPIILNIDLKD